MSEHRDWQRQTALSKVERLRSEAETNGAPMCEVNPGINIAGVSVVSSWPLICGNCADASLISLTVMPRIALHND